MWERRQCWALSFRVGLPTRGNNTNNYVERSFGILKDIVFARIQAYNCVQVFQFITMGMKRFYVLRLLSFAYRHIRSFTNCKTVFMSRMGYREHEFYPKE